MLSIGTTFIGRFGQNNQHASNTKKLVLKGNVQFHLLRHFEIYLPIYQTYRYILPSKVLVTLDSYVIFSIT